MNITREISPDGEATLTISLPAEVIGGKFKEAFDKFRAEASIPGFRPGKAPLGFVKQRYGKAINVDVADDLARDYAKQAIEQEKLKIGGTVKLDLKTYGEDKGLTFTASFPLKPQPHLTHYRGLRIMVNDADIAESDIDDQIEGLRHKHALLESIDDPAPANSILTLKAREIDPSGLPLIGRAEENIILEFGEDRLGIGSDEQLLGVRAGETRTIKIRQPQSGLVSAPTDHQIIGLNELNNQTNQPNEKYLHIEVLSVEVPQLPEVDDDFAKSVNEKLQHIADLRNYVKFTLMGYIGADVQRRLERGIIHRLVEDNPFPLAKSLVEETMMLWAEENKVPISERRRLFEENFADTEHNMRWIYLRDEIATVENIEVSEEETNQEVQRIADRTGEPLEVIERRIEQSDIRERLADRLLDRRVIDFLVRYADIERRKMTVQEYIQTMEE